MATKVSKSVTVPMFKRPSMKNFNNRSVSFSHKSEFEFINEQDSVELTVVCSTTNRRVFIEMSGAAFHATIKKVKMDNKPFLFLGTNEASLNE